MSDDTIKTESGKTEVKSEDVKEETKKESEASIKKEEDETMSEAQKEEDAKKAEEERKKKEELKKKYANWPQKAIKDPHDNDVMYGRGGGTNHHPGNKQYRKMVEDRKLEYVNSKRLDKPLVALEIIRLWRGQVPPGRFLKLDEKTGLWNDVGDKKAREKTSQALREKAPLIRKQQEDEKEKDDVKGGKSGDAKVTRFAAGTKTESSKAEKPVLARDHSLGREYLQDGEAVSVEGFSWRDPFLAEGDKRTPSFGSVGAGAAPMAPAAPGAYPPAGRHSSSGSLGIAPPHHGGPPPPPDYYGRVGSSQMREYSTGRIESWSSFPYPPPPPPPAVHGPTHQRSGSWTYSQTPAPSMPGHQRSGSWSAREHSLAFNPLIGASVAHPADRGTFEGRGGPPQQYWAPGPYRSPPRQLSPTNSTPSPKPTYNVGIDIARTWSGGAEGNPRPGPAWAQQQSQQMAYSQPVPAPGSDISPMRSNNVNFMPKPQMVKRDTSHQAESQETKHQVKRAALNRDNSMASNRLKEQYMPEVYSGKFNTEHEVKQLSDNLEQSQLSPKGAALNTAKPESLKDSNRLTTLDINELMAKPEPLSTRTTTIEALGIDLENEPMFDAPIEGSNIPRPNAMTTDNRLTTTEIYDLVNADPEDLVKVEDGPPPLNQEAVADNWLTQS
ncbi:MAG: hypothetical protein SGBAC_000786 [Bacillariaceae sp.]